LCVGAATAAAMVMKEATMVEKRILFVCGSGDDNVSKRVVDV